VGGRFGIQRAFAVLNRTEKRRKRGLNPNDIFLIRDPDDSSSSSDIIKFIRGLKKYLISSMENPLKNLRQFGFQLQSTMGEIEDPSKDF